MGKILVPIDGSQFTERVVSEASELATRYHLDIELLNVQPLTPYPYMSAEVKDAEKERVIKTSAEILNKAESQVNTYAKNVKVHKKTLIGNAAEEIVEYADKSEADLIVLGYKGMSDIKRFFLGSVSSKVLLHSKQSVFVVK